jgi:elongation factor Ts
MDGSLITQERSIFVEQLKNEGKPAELVDRIVDGKMEKFYQETVLLEQPYVRDDKKKVEVVVKEAIAKLGENIVVRRFQRFALGQE